MNRSKSNVAVSDGFVTLTHQLRVEILVLIGDPGSRALECCVAGKHAAVGSHQRYEGDERVLTVIIAGTQEGVPGAESCHEVFVPDRPQAEFSLQPVLLALPCVRRVPAFHRRMLAASGRVRFANAGSHGTHPPHALGNATRHRCRVVTLHTHGFSATLGFVEAPEREQPSPDPFARWFHIYAGLRAELAEASSYQANWTYVRKSCFELSTATWSLARMARTTGTPFIAMLRLRSELVDVTYRLNGRLPDHGFVGTLVPLMVQASVEVEHLLLEGTQHRNPKLTPKQQSFFEAMQGLGKAATIEEVVMKAGGRSKKVNSDDRETMRELTGALINGFVIEAVQEGNRRTYVLRAVADTSRR